MQFLANNNLVNIRIFQQLPNLIAADPLDDRLLTNDVVYLTVAYHHHSLFDPLAGPQDKLIELKHEKKIYEEGEGKDAGWERAPPGPEDINKNHAEQCAAEQPQENPSEQIPGRSEPAFVDSKEGQNRNVDQTQKNKTLPVGREIVFRQGYAISNRKGDQNAEVDYDGIDHY